MKMSIDEKIGEIIIENEVVDRIKSMMKIDYDDQSYNRKHFNVFNGRRPTVGFRI